MSPPLRTVSKHMQQVVPPHQDLDVITVHEEFGRCVGVTGDLQGMLGHDPAKVVPGGTYPFVHPQDIPVVSTHHAARLQGEMESAWMVYRLRHADGHYVWVQTTSRTVDVDGSTYLGALTRPVGIDPGTAQIVDAPLPTTSVATR